MSTVTITKWGNSVGIRVPATIVKEAHLVPEEKLEISIDKKGVLTLVSIKNPQEGWTEKFNAIADANHEDSLLELSSDFDADEWTW